MGSGAGHYSSPPFSRPGIFIHSEEKQKGRALIKNPVNVTAMINPFCRDIPKILSGAAVMLLILLVVDTGCTQPAAKIGRAHV
jgi:hypothetical protein